MTDVSHEHFNIGQSQHECFLLCVSYSMFVLLFPGLVSYIVSVKGAVTAALKVTLMDKQGHCVASSNGPFGVLKVQDVKLWWPYLTHENPGYLYSMEVRLQACMELIQ